ncbi:MAG: putative Ig domain-containing protein, partial [bacterium]|nr:putative Ig domain-containing protein [bacterium]
LYCRDVEMDDWWVAYVVPPEEGAIDPSLPPIGDDISVEDDYLSIEVGEMELDVDEDFEEMAENCISLESGSKVTLKVAGLPAGLKYDVKTGIVKGKTTKASAYWVTWTATNANGYKFTAMQKWVVGGVDVGDYDDIGISEYLDEVDFCTGLPLEEFCLNAGLKSVSGLPVGVKFQAGGKCSGDVCSACGDFISGMPTKVGKYTVTFIDSWRQKTVKTIVVRDGGSHYVNVKCGNGQNNRGAVTGTGVYSAGAKVKLTAKPAAGYYFAGWYLDEDCTEPYEGDSDYRTQNLTFVQSADEDGGAFYARFVSKAEDMSLEFVGGGLGSWNWDVDTESTQDSYWFEVTSETLPKVTAKGLPSGVKLAFVDGYYALQVTDVSKLKPGTSLVTLTAKNLSGATAQQVVRVVVPNIQNSFFEGLVYNDSAYSFRVGESFACRADLWLFDCPPGATVSATGVPPGLRFVYDKSWGSASLMGMATKAGVYTVTLTAKNGALTAKATFTVEVKAFPTEAVGSYGGDIGYDFSEDDSEDGIGYGIYNVGGSFSLTVAKDGKISVKYPANGGMVSLSGYSCYVTEEEIYVYLSDAKGNWCDLLVYPGGGLGTYQVEGSFGDLWSEWSALGQRNVAKTDPQMKEMVTSLSKIGKIQGVVLGSDKIACPGCVYGYVSPSLTFTVGLDGMVKASGKINGRSVSGAALLQVLQTEDDYILYADFYDYKSTTGLLVYRAVFYWSLLRDYHPLGWSALCDGSYYSTRGAVACKPVIYLYPEEETVCGVKLELNGKLTCTYPDYALNGWLDFVAAPDGTLTFQDARQFYCLYWEGQMNTSWDFSRGYCVKGSETASFLSDVLLRMGLSFREANEFIIYWLPQMQDNPYNVISFQGENYMKAAKLQIEPQPESVLRVFMAWRPSRYLVSIPAPDIKPFERRGFTVVEWGGAKVCD